METHKLCKVLGLLSATKRCRNALAMQLRNLQLLLLRSQAQQLQLTTDREHSRPLFAEFWCDMLFTACLSRYPAFGLLSNCTAKFERGLTSWARRR
jgi:hypothetical protein